MSFEACLHIGQIGSRLIGRRIGGTKSRKFAGIDNLKTSDLNRTLAFSTSFSSPTASQDRGDRMADVTASRSEWGRYTASYEFTAETVGKGEPVSLEDSSLTERPGETEGGVITFCVLSCRSSRNTCSLRASSTSANTNSESKPQDHRFISHLHTHPLASDSFHRSADVPPQRSLQFSFGMRRGPFWGLPDTSLDVQENVHPPPVRFTPPYGVDGRDPIVGTSQGTHHLPYF